MNSGTRYHKSSEVVMGCRGANEKARDVDGEALPGGNPRTLSREERAETGWQPHRHVDQEGATRVDGVLRGGDPPFGSGNKQGGRKRPLRRGADIGALRLS